MTAQKRRERRARKSKAVEKAEEAKLDYSFMGNVAPPHKAKVKRHSKRRR